MGMAISAPGHDNALALVSTADMRDKLNEAKEQMYLLGFDDARRKILAIFAEFEPSMYLNIDIRNDYVDAVNSLKAI